MSEGKEERLQRLAAAGGAVPKTIDASQLADAADRGATARWFVRATSGSPRDRHQIAQGPFTTAELTGQRMPLEPGTVVQEYVEPVYSGVTFTDGKAFLTATIAGPCRPLLRDGATGGLHARAGGEEWSAGYQPTSAEQIRAVEDGLAEIDVAEPMVIEWIMSTVGVRHVDLKLVGQHFGSSVLFPRPLTITMGTPAGMEPTVVPDTSFAHFDETGAPQHLRADRGCPLSHLAVETVRRGGSIRVAVASETDPGDAEHPAAPAAP